MLDGKERGLSGKRLSREWALKLGQMIKRVYGLGDGWTSAKARVVAGAFASRLNVERWVAIMVAVMVGVDDWPVLERRRAERDDCEDQEPVGGENNAR